MVTQAIHRRESFLLWHPILLGIVMLTFVGAALLSISAAASTDAPLHVHHEPITLRAKLDIGNDVKEGYWIAGFGDATDDEPDVLALTWSPTPAGWFGSVWGIQVATDAGLLPTRSVTEGDGFLAGMDYYNVHNVEPVPGHTYEFTLAYDPRSGALALSVVDETLDELIVEHGLQVNPYAGALFPSVGHASDASVTLTETHPYFIPSGLQWRLVQLDEHDLMLPAHQVDRRRDVFLHVRMPWEELPGDLRLWLDDGGTAYPVVTVSDPVDRGLYPLSFADTVTGEYDIVAEYSSRENAVAVGTFPVHVGVVYAAVDDVRISLIGPKEIEFRGDLVVHGDGPIHETIVTLDAVLDRVILAPASQENAWQFATERDLTQSVLVQQFPYIDEDSVRTPFTKTVSLQSNVEWPYRIWDALLEPSVESPAASERTSYKETVRVYADGEPAATESVRVLSYNIQHGTGIDGRIDLQRLADVIAYSRADIVGLQEVDSNTSRSHGVDQAAVLAELLGMNMAFGPNLAIQGGLYGNAVLSRYPIIESRNLRLTRTAGETRGLLHSVVDVAGTPVSFYVTHLSLHDDENERQRADIVAYLRSTQRPFVLLGDFNMLAGLETDPRGMLDPIVRDAWLEAVSLSPAGSRLRTMSTSGNTFSSASPNRRIDYIFLSDEMELVGHEAFFIIQTLASDHLPLGVELYVKD